jgi:hypothetical protein
VSIVYQPDLDVVNYLNASLPQLTLGVNLFAGPIRAYSQNPDPNGVPHSATFCLNTGGRNPTTFINGSVKRIQIKKPMVHVKHRSNPYNFSEGQNTADAILNAVDRKQIGTYIDSQVNDGSPNYLGEDKDGHHSWSVNINMMYWLQEYLVYWGVAPAGGTGEAFITSLSDNAYSTNRYRNFSLTTGAGEHMYYCFPEEYSSIGSVAFSVPFSVTSTSAVDGTPYQVWMSSSDNLGVSTVSVTSQGKTLDVCDLIKFVYMGCILWTANPPLLAVAVFRRPSYRGDILTNRGLTPLGEKNDSDSR